MYNAVLNIKLHPKNNKKYVKY